MSALEILLLGIVIGSNNFAAALTLGALGQIHRRMRIVLVFGIFEFVIPLVGIILGRTVVRFVEFSADFIGAALLLLIGCYALYKGVQSQSPDQKFARLMTTWRGLCILALGLSLDNLAVGFSLGLRQAPALLVAAVIACFACFFAWWGLSLGAASRRHWERYSKIATGLLLILLAILILAGWL